MAKPLAAAISKVLPLTDSAADPDIALMLALKNGDDSVFAELVSRHQARVFALVYRFVANEAEADDLAQEVFLRVYRTRHRYQPKARFSTWLYRIAVNVSLNALRSRTRRHTINMPLLADSQDSQDDRTTAPVIDYRAGQPNQRIEDEELRDQVRAAVEQLPDNQKVAVILNKYEGMSYEDTASLMNCSVMAVKSLLARARNNLRDRLEFYLETGRVRRSVS